MYNVLCQSLFLQLLLLAAMIAAAPSCELGTIQSVLLPRDTDTDTVITFIAEMTG